MHCTCCTLHCNTLNYIVINWIKLQCTKFHFNAVQCSVLPCTEPNCELNIITALHNIARYCTEHCTVFYTFQPLYFELFRRLLSMAPWPLFIHLYHSSLAWHSLVLPEYITTSGIYNRYQNISKLLEHITAN